MSKIEARAMAITLACGWHISGDGTHEVYHVSIAKLLSDRSLIPTIQEAMMNGDAVVCDTQGQRLDIKPAGLASAVAAWQNHMEPAPQQGGLQCPIADNMIQPYVAPNQIHQSTVFQSGTLQGDFCIEGWIQPTSQSSINQMASDEMERVYSNGVNQASSADIARLAIYAHSVKLYGVYNPVLYIKARKITSMDMVPALQEGMRRGEVVICDDKGKGLLIYPHQLPGLVKDWIEWDKREAKIKAEGMMCDYKVTVVGTDDNMMIKAQMEDHKVIEAPLTRIKTSDCTLEMIPARDVSVSRVKPAITGLCAVTPMGRG